jgi:hypothetical protein
VFSSGTGKKKWKLASSVGHHKKILRKTDKGDRMVARVGGVTYTPPLNPFNIWLPFNRFMRMSTVDILMKR